MPDELDASFTDTITAAQRDLLIGRLRTAWNNLPAETQAQFKPILDKADQQFANYVATGTPPSHDLHTMLRIKSYLTGDWDDNLARSGHPLSNPMAQPLAAPIGRTAIELSVGPEGDIIGFGKYQTLDPRWELIIGIALFENAFAKHPFPPGIPPIVRIADNSTFVLIGDYGTGNFGSSDSPSTKISKFVPSLAPNFTIHLGDVYYAGLDSEERAKLLAFWPGGSVASFTLNSNHEMYSGAGGYFNTAVGNPIFNAFQSPWSFFALETDDWVIVGLDSAYYSPAPLYMNGTLGTDNNQTQFLQQIAALNKKTIILTHHNPIPIGGLNRVPQPGDEGFQLYSDVMTAFAPSVPVYWYFGHKHVGAAYTPLAGSPIYRCVGHGALPAGVASDLVNSTNLDWFERCNAGDPDDNLRIYNGFVKIELNGPNLIETFYDELGRVAWTPGTEDTRCLQIHPDGFVDLKDRTSQEVISKTDHPVQAELLTIVEQMVAGNMAVNGQRDLTKGVIIVLSGGPVDWTNPPEVLDRMDTLISEVNADPFVVANTGGQGLTFKLLADQQTNHIHQARWKDLCDNPKLVAASPLILIGHSNGGAAVIDLARWLHDQGTVVDFVFTADSVFTLDDNGDCYKVPTNVNLNMNSHTIPTPLWVVLPFPFGQENHRESDGSLDGILNIGLPFEEPGALAHRDCFYDLAGGDSTGPHSYKYPELIRDSALAVLKGATNDEVIQMAQQYLQVLADDVNISIDIESAAFATTLQPAGSVVGSQTPRLGNASVAAMREAMNNLERVRLSAS